MAVRHHSEPFKASAVLCPEEEEAQVVNAAIVLCPASVLCKQQMYLHPFATIELYFQNEL